MCFQKPVFSTFLNVCPVCLVFFISTYNRHLHGEALSSPRLFFLIGCLSKQPYPGGGGGGGKADTQQGPQETSTRAD